MNHLVRHELNIEYHLVDLFIHCGDLVLQDLAKSNARHNDAYAFLLHLDPIVLSDRNFGATARAIVKYGSESIVYGHLLEKCFLPQNGSCCSKNFPDSENATLN